MRIWELKHSELCGVLSKEGMDVGIHSLLRRQQKGEGLSFSPTLGRHLPGEYAFVDEEGFHLVFIGDRGKIGPHMVYQHLFDVLFEIYYGVTGRLANEYAMRNREEGKDWRRVLFPKKLELLRLLGEDYYLKGKRKIERILESHPYDDEALGISRTQP